jgi:hypothetical protein
VEASKEHRTAEELAKWLNIGASEDAAYFADRDLCVVGRELGRTHIDRGSNRPGLGNGLNNIVLYILIGKDEFRELADYH